MSPASGQLQEVLDHPLSNYVVRAKLHATKTLQTETNQFDRRKFKIVVRMTNLTIGRMQRLEQLHIFVELR